MVVQGDKILQFSIDNPASCTVSILAFYPKYRLVTVKRMQAIADADSKAMEEDRYAPLIAFITLEPQSKHESRKTTSNEFIGNVDAVASDGRLSRGDWASRRLWSNVGNKSA